MTSDQEPSGEGRFAGSGSGSGGAEGVRAWAGELLRKAESGLLPDPAGPPRLPPAPLAPEDPLIGELDQLIGLLDEEDPLRVIVQARLGGLLAVRYRHLPGRPGDRTRATALLRSVRARRSRLPSWEGQRAALYLFTLLLPAPHGDPHEAVRDLAGLMARGQEYRAALGPDGPDRAELLSLLDDILEAPLPPQERCWFDVLATALRTPPTSPAHLVSQLRSMLDALPPGYPAAEELRDLLNTTVPPAPPSPRPTAGATGAASAGKAERTDAGEAPDAVTLLDLAGDTLQDAPSPERLADLADLAESAATARAGAGAAGFGALLAAAPRLLRAVQLGELELLAEAA